MRFYRYLIACVLITFSAFAGATSGHHGTSHSSNSHNNTFTASADKSLFVATTGEVILTFLSKSADYSDDLSLRNTSSSILNNQTVSAGQQFSLGSFQAGTELVFKLFVNNTGLSFYSGLAGNNVDHVLHAAYKFGEGKSVIVGFEDLFNGGDKDYNDLIFSLSNVCIGKVVIAPIPEPSTYALMLMGLLMLGVAAKRRKQ